MPQNMAKCLRRAPKPLSLQFWRDIHAHRTRKTISRFIAQSWENNWVELLGPCPSKDKPIAKNLPKRVFSADGSPLGPRWTAYSLMRKARIIRRMGSSQGCYTALICTLVPTLCAQWNNIPGLLAPRTSFILRWDRASIKQTGRVNLTKSRTNCLHQSPWTSYLCIQ